LISIKKPRREVGHQHRPRQNVLATSDMSTPALVGAITRRIAMINKTALVVFAALVACLPAVARDAAVRPGNMPGLDNPSGALAARAQARPRKTKPPPSQRKQTNQRDPWACIPRYDSSGVPRGPYC
jgi:hypothetical protein